MIYLTREDWNNFFLPKLTQDNKSFFTELKHIKNIHSIMQYINSKIKISNQIVLSISMIYFHKFYNQTLINLINITPLDKLIICGSCIFIATKSSNHLIRVSVIVNIIMDIIKKKLPNLNIDLDTIKEKNFSKRISNFIINRFFVLILSHHINIYYKNYFDSITNISSQILIDSCFQFISDSFLLPISLYYTPNLISISCVKVMKEKFNLVDININDLISLSEYKIDLNELNECYSIIKKLYDKEENLTNNSSLSTKNSN